MREFLLLLSKGRTTADFDSCNAYAAGRLDIACRFITNCLCISNSIRSDTIVHIALNGPKDPPKMITIEGNKITGLKPDEKSALILIKSALVKKLKGVEECEASPGLKVSKMSFEAFLKQKKDAKLYYLHESGADIRSENFTGNSLFIIGDYSGLPGKAEMFVSRLCAESISLGPKTLLASQCATIIHNELDRKGN